MKKTTIYLIMLLLSINCFSQNDHFVYTGRKNQTCRVEEINKAVSIYDICHGLWQQMELPAKMRILLDSLKKNEFSIAYYTYDKIDYSMLVDIESVKIYSSMENNSSMAYSGSEILSTEQKNLIKAQALGSTIKILINFRIKDKYANGKENDVKSGLVRLSLIPFIEAKFIGGFEKMNQYLNQATYNQVNTKKEYAQLNEIKIKFTIDSQGNPNAQELLVPSKNEKLNQLVLKALKNMPSWIPAKDVTGKNVSQNFEFLFTNNDFDGC
jgi:hypothetical protein